MNLSTNTASLGIRALPRTLSHLHWHKCDFICVCFFFCDCQSHNKNGLWIDSYDRKMSVKWAAFLLGVSNLWLHANSIDHYSTDHNFLLLANQASFHPHWLRLLNRLLTMGDCSLVQMHGTDQLPKMQQKQKCLWQGCIKCMSTK